MKFYDMKNGLMAGILCCWIKDVLNVVKIVDLTKRNPFFCRSVFSVQSGYISLSKFS